MSAPLPARACLIAAMALASVVAGCSADHGDYPSLSPRKVEDQSLAEPTLPAPPAGTPSAAASAEYAPIVEKARAADSDFRATLAAARAAIVAGSGAATGSDAWLAAQTALTRVEAARAPVAAALADLDAARRGDAVRTDSGRAAAVDAAYGSVQAIDADEQRALAEATPAR